MYGGIRWGMHCYQAFGLAIGSDLPLPDLPVTHQAPDVLIRQRRMSAASLADKHDGGESIAGLVAGGAFRFLVERGREIWFDYDEDFAGTDMIPSILLGMVFAAVLRQRGLLVLHASSVAKDGCAIGFVGDSGWGKSTLAEYFCQRGYTLLSDDIVAIQLEDSAAVALPAFPQVKLLPDAGLLLRHDYGELRVLHGEMGKRARVANEHYNPAPCPVKSLFVLEDAVKDRPRVADLPGHRAVMELTRHTRMRHMFTRVDFQRGQVQLCGKLIRRAQVRVLYRVPALEQLPAIFACVDQLVSAPSKSVNNG